MNWLKSHIAARRAAAALRKDTGQGPEPCGLAPLDFRQALARPRVEGVPAVIAEVKFRSPSLGWIRPALDVEAVAAGYAAAGASALSILVDEAHFGGHLSFLARAKAASGLPVLAKGFFVDPVEVRDLAASGADALLLIARCLDRSTLVAMLEEARACGLAALVELHDDADLALIEGLAPSLVGVNHRNLETLTMDLDLSRRLAPGLPQGALKVAESGLSTRGDLDRMKGLGYGAVLVGSAFMGTPDPGAALAAFLEQAHA